MKALLWMWSCHNEDTFAKVLIWHPGSIGDENGGSFYIPFSVDGISAQGQEVTTVNLLVLGR